MKYKSELVNLNRYKSNLKEKSNVNVVKMKENNNSILFPCHHIHRPIWESLS